MNALVHALMAGLLLAGCGRTSSDEQDGDVIPNLPRVYAGGGQSCLLDATGSAICWGLYAEPIPDDPFVALAVGGTFICGLRAEGTLTCWGALTDATETSFKAVAAGSTFVCAIDENALARCWGWPEEYPGVVPGDQFREVAAGKSTACGVTTEGQVKCWGSNLAGEAAPPLSSATNVSVGQSHACALTSASHPVCWGLFEEFAGVPDEPVRSVVAGGFGTCIIALDHTVKCVPDYLEPPPGDFGQIAVGESHACGVRRSGGVECWGSNGFGQASPP